MIEIGSERFDPKAAATRARRQTNAGRQKLADALGVRIEDVPGGDREGYLLQFEDDLDSVTVRRLGEEYGLQLTQGPSSLVFVERLDSPTAARVRRNSAVRACIPYPPHLKLTGFSKVSELGPDPVVRVGLFTDADIPRLRAAVESLGLEVVHVDEAPDHSGAGTMHVRVTSDAGLAILTAFSEVRWVWPLPRMRMHNLDTAGVIQGGGRSTHTVWAHGLHGEGMVIGIIDNGLLDMAHKFFTDSNPAHPTPGPAHRKVVELRPDPSSVVSDHGTAVSGCAAGDEDSNAGAHAYRGGAWAARLAYGDAARAFHFPSPVSSLTRELISAANAGAFIHSNSYGLLVGVMRPEPYDPFAREADQFTFDNEDHLILVAGVNTRDGGFDGGIVLSKNAIAVNASRDFSNRDDFHSGKSGLTGDGRRKPDLVAVGENVTTSGPSPRLIGVPVNPLALVVVGGVPGDGTSAATPHVAAAAALVRQYFVEGFFPSGQRQVADSMHPSGALLKAMLLNATVDMQNGTYPVLREGWGRLQLDTTLHFVGDKLLLWVEDVRHSEGLERNGATKSFFVDVPSGAKQIKCTLVFTDPPHAHFARDPVVNQLDLEATDPTLGVSYYGNDFLGGTSRPRTAPPLQHELRNNVRQVRVQSPPPGRWELLVRAHTVDQTLTPVVSPLLRSTQGYALVTCVEVT
jgi:hypothetical protein